MVGMDGWEEDQVILTGSPQHTLPVRQFPRQALIRPISVAQWIHQCPIIPMRDQTSSLSRQERYPDPRESSAEECRLRRHL